MSKKEYVHTCVICKLPFASEARNTQICEHCKPKEVKPIVATDHTTPRACNKCGRIFVPSKCPKPKTKRRNGFSSYNRRFCRPCKELESQPRKCLQYGKELGYRTTAFRFCNGDCAMLFQIELSNARQRARQEGDLMNKASKPSEKVVKEKKEIEIGLVGEIEQ